MRQSMKTVSPMSNEGRNLYVVKHITDALLKLIRSRCLNGISISQICEEAGVGRASFYRNYESKEDVLRKYLERLIREWEKDFENKGDLAFFSESMLRHFYKYLYNALSVLLLSHSPAFCLWYRYCCNCDRSHPEFQSCRHHMSMFFHLSYTY